MTPPTSRARERERIERIVASVEWPWLTVAMVWRVLRLPERRRSTAHARTVVAIFRAHGYDHCIGQPRGNERRWVRRTSDEVAASSGVAQDSASLVALLRQVRRMMRGSKQAQRTFGLEYSIVMAQVDQALARHGVARTEEQQQEVTT